MGELNLIQKIAVWVLPVLFAITAHEAAHGWAAGRLGDATAEHLGRVTLNPIKHVDPMGTILFPGLMLFLGLPFVFGWAKPVPVDWRNFRNPKRDMALVAAAGPGSNLIMAVVWALGIHLAIGLYPVTGEIVRPLVYMAWAGVTINVALLVLNLLPIPPLDGGRVMAGLLPMRLAAPFARLEPFGLFIVIALLVLGILQPLLAGAIGAFSTFFAIP